MTEDQDSQIADGPIRWSVPESWRARVGAILDAVSEQDAALALQAPDVSELYEDDPDWVSAVAEAIGTPKERLAEAVAERLAPGSVRVFHGTRTADAGSFAAEGIRLHDRQRIEAELRALVQHTEELQWLKPLLDQRFAETAHLIDHGRCYVVVDERMLIEECGHYLLGGSEFLQGILGADRAQSLLRHCAPTVIEVDLPLRRASQAQRSHLAAKLIGDWARMLRSGRTEARRLDFTFILQEAVPPSWVVGHFHPPVVNDPHQMDRPVKSKITVCAACGRSGA